MSKSQQNKELTDVRDLRGKKSVLLIGFRSPRNTDTDTEISLSLLG